MSRSRVPCRRSDFLGSMPMVSTHRNTTHEECQGVLRSRYNRGMRYLAAALAVSMCALAQPAKKPFDTAAMMRIARISEPRLSPDGRLVAFTVERPDVTANTRPKQIYVAPVAGGSPTPITTEGSNSRPRWTGDSKRIVFVSNRGGGTPQVWSMNADGTDQKAIT